VHEIDNSIPDQQDSLYCPTEEENEILLNITKDDTSNIILTKIFDTQLKILQKLELQKTRYATTREHS
jgi:hypothetical protein